MQAFEVIEAVRGMERLIKEMSIENAELKRGRGMLDPTDGEGIAAR